MRSAQRTGARASLPVLVAVFGTVFVALIVLAAQSDDRPSAPTRDELLAYEEALAEPTREAGVAIVMGIRPDITDFRAGRITAEVFRRDLEARAAQFVRAGQSFAQAPVPDGLEAAAARFERAFARYEEAVATLMLAAAAEGAQRETLLQAGAQAGDQGDEHFDQAVALVNTARQRVGLPPLP